MNAPADIPADQPLEQGFRLDELTIDPRAGEVTGPAGREKLDPKVMDVLVMLAQNAGHVVLRGDLQARLWPNAVVTDASLSRCIYELRRQLSQASGDERYKAMLETVPKRGFRLNGDVVITAAPPAAGPLVRSKWRYPALIAAPAAAVLLLMVFGERFRDSPAKPRPSPVAAVENSIAVLPFIDMSEGQDQGHFSDGISEEILSRLAQAKDLRVIARTSSFSLRDRSLDVAEIAKRLNVTHVLEGSVRKSGDQFRITVQLISTSNSSHVWSETFDRGLGDVFAVQDEIATAVAAALQATLERGNPNARSPANFDAFEKFTQGEFYYYRRAPGDIERSVRYYEEAVSIDPRYARAWAALAGAYSYLAWAGSGVDKVLQRRQGDAARKAVELDPGLAVAHARLAHFYDETMNKTKRDEHERLALELDPEDPLVLSDLGGKAFERGDLDQAIAMHRRALTRDPLNTVTRNNLAVILLADERLDEAMSEYRKILEFNPDAGSNVEIDIVRILALQRRYDETHSAIAKLPEGKQRDYGLALMYQAPGGRAEADAALARLVAQPDDDQSVDADIVDGIRLAEVQAFRGMKDRAFESLENKKSSLEHRWGSESPVVWYFTHEAKVSPFLKTLHADPRWTTLTTFAGR